CGGAPTNGLDQRGYPRDALCDIGAFEYYDRSISGWVWFDTDGDGIQDAGEVPGVGGVNVTLNPGGLVATTNSQGYYVFAGLPAGSYTATFSNLPADYGFTLQNQGGSDDLDSDPDPATGTTQAITLGSPPDNEHNWDAGIIPSDLTVTKSNSVGGNTWDWTLSINNNGSADMTFNASEVILVDELPAGPTYPAAAAVTLTGATGTMTCPIAAGVLTCTAATPVTIGYSGSIEVEIGGITADAGQYANSTGVCTVDPNDVVDEDDETNNDCNTDVITVLGEGTVQGSGGSGHGSVSTTTTVVTVTESAPEYITIAVDNPAAAGGETVTYTITAYNPKNIPLTDVVIYDIFHDLLGDFQIVSNTHGTAIISNDTLIVNGFTLQPGETATIIVTAIISDDYRAGDVIPNVAVLESPDASIHVSNLILIGDIANRSDGDSVSVMVMPGKLPETGGDLLATGDEPNRRGWIYALAGVALLIAAGWIVQRRLASRSAG
ncbi:MAG: DUF11 domain-containing protein, partial [Anaerolineae bacterium]|nr:DUF11 domain-containing protein [Anaerolineae bacterium]